MKNIKFTAILAILLLSAFVSAAWAQEDQCPDPEVGHYSKSDTFYGGCGSEEKPYIIDSPVGLDTLSKRVNSGVSSYEGVYFKLAADIEYSYTSKTENNYTAIGTEDNPFKGVFNGDGHTISGIRINKTGAGFQGLFGHLGKNGEVMNVTLADTEIKTFTSYDDGVAAPSYNVGGIVGYNDQGTVSGCTVENSVKIISSGDYAESFGGIVGRNTGTVSDCISSATVTSTGENSDYFGGIVGDNTNYAKVSGNFAKNVTVSAASYYGAVSGGIVYRSDLSNNFYTACTVGGKENATDVGVGVKEYTYDATDENGAVAVFAVTLGEGVTITSPETPIYIDNDKNVYYKYNEKVTLTAKKIELIEEITGVKATIAPDKISATFTMLNENVEISATTSKIWGVAEGRDGSMKHPYTIASVLELNTLASLVNSGNDFENTYFEVTKDISYNVADTVDGSNYTAIGTDNNYPFKGKFNGNNHTIRGIRIFRPKDHRQGFFSKIGNGAVVENVTLADAEITTGCDAGGIVGWLDGGEIRNCTVGKDVKIVYSGEYGGCSIGGIVGDDSRGPVSGCTSSVTIVSSREQGTYYGGIVGTETRSTFRDNLVIGATIMVADYCGAVVGFSAFGTLLNNYYTASSVAGVENATNVGAGFYKDSELIDVTKDNGAVSVSVKAPTAVENLVYNGSSQNLVTAGETNYGTMLYSLDGKNYSAEIPAASGANTYTVYYKVVKDDKWNVYDAQKVEVEIAEDKQVSIIGHIETRTGEFKMLRNYDLNGRQGKAKASGAYYGKKVLVK